MIRHGVFVEFYNFYVCRSYFKKRILILYENDLFLFLENKDKKIYIFYYFILRNKFRVLTKLASFKHGTPSII